MPALESKSKSIPLYVLMILLAAAGFAFAFISPAASDISPSLIEILSSARPSGGRLFESRPFEPSAEELQRAMDAAQLAILSQRDGRRLQGLMDINRGNLASAVPLLLDLSRDSPGDVEVLNDLGVVYLALGDHNAAQYFKAIEVLERARRLDPAAFAPRFNLVLAYRRAGLNELTELRQAQYERLEHRSDWIGELAADGRPIDESRLAAEMQRLLTAGDESAAAVLFEKHVDVFRRLATDEALNPQGDAGPSPSLRFTARRLWLDRQDATLISMLAPLETPGRTRIIRSRVLVQQGITAYVQTKYSESSHLYDQAESEIAGIPSGFDRSWIGLNRANSAIRLDCSLQCAANARAVLEGVIGQASREHWRWLRAEALTSIGSGPLMTPDYGQLVQTLTEAIDELNEIGAGSDSVRAANYLAVIYNFAGDFEGSFQYINRSRTQTVNTDHLRLSQLYVLAGSVAYRLGCSSCAIEFEKEGLLEARKTQNSLRTANALASLATVYEAIGQTSLAARYLHDIRTVLDGISASFSDKNMIAFPANLLCGQIDVADGDFKAAEACLKNNLEILRQNPEVTPIYHSVSLLQLARIYILTGRSAKARETFRQATEVIESNDNYFASPNLRSFFENERRSLYDAAITFEADHDGSAAAWSYLQHYRSKLFLEFLGTMNPKVNEIHSEAVQRSQVQRLIPPNVQVVEYRMLPDRLLIWLVSDNKFVFQTVATPRVKIQESVHKLLDIMEKRGDVTAQSGDLYRLLIGPIEDSLDRHRTLAIIPDQDLHRLPFATLWNARARRYLVEDYALLESPNLTQLLAVPGTPSRTSAVAFGDAVDDGSVSGELTDLKSYYPNDKTFTGSDANKQQFLAAMKDAEVFHYSGHSVDASDPLRSSLLLDGDHEGPNSITALEVSQQHMRANSVVVLASCDSSVGNSRDGIGMRGLTSAFLISGAGSVVGSLWPVESVSTARLVSDFHKTFSAGASVAQALRQAQLGFIQFGGGRAHPYYWSGFVVTGNTSALR